jgi:hypothetical protein
MFQQQDNKADDKEVDRMHYEMLDADLKVELDEEVPAPPVALSFGTHSYTTRKGMRTEETPIATYGNFSFIQAPPKSYKSFFTSLLVSAFLKDNKWAGDKFSSYRKDKSVFHFDTEQGRWHCQRGFRRVSDMANTMDNYHTYSLRTIGYKQRLGFIEYILSNAKEDSIGLVVIDGVADLVSDVNDITECNLCVQKLMEWSAKYNCHISTIIHSNHNSTKPTGHLGSFLEKKAETQISLNREEDSKVVNVSCKRSRNYGFEDFDFFINRFGFPEVIDASTPDIDF